jgi:hypothetical protein
MRLIEDVMVNKMSRGTLALPEATYREIGRLNPSSLAAGLMSNMEVDPLMIRLAYESGDIKRTAAVQDQLDRGTLAHLFILQPELVESRVAVWDGDRRSGKGWDEFINANIGKLLIREEDFREVQYAAQQALSVPRVRQMLTGIEVEVSLLGEEDGIKTKGRVDGLRRGELPLILDLKTTKAGIDSNSVKRTIRDFHYREKMAMYRRMFCQATNTEPDLVQCCNIFLKLPPPVSIRIVKFSTGALEFGEFRMLKAIESVRACIETGQWPIFVGDDVADVDQWELPDEEEVDIEY